MPIEVREQLAQHAAKSGDPRASDHWLREIVSADAQAGSARTERTKYLAAKRAAGTGAAAARCVPRHPPGGAAEEEPGRQAQVRMEAALAAYKRAAEYQVAEVTTAATYETAELYRRLGKDVLDSERPKNLNRR